MSTIRKRRLLKLADLLEYNAKNRKGAKFDMGTWGRVDDANAEPEMSCGTTCCALGLAAISGTFKRAGLGFEIHKDNTTSPIQIIYRNPKTGRKLRGDALDAATKVFHITRYEAEHLFIPMSYPCGFFESGTTGAKVERKVAKRIRKLAETGNF